MAASEQTNLKLIGEVPIQIQVSKINYMVVTYVSTSNSGMFRTRSNIYNGAFEGKQLAFTRSLISLKSSIAVVPLGSKYTCLNCFDYNLALLQGIVITDL